ncbi:type II toxin-antitoxin system CcdA family antitoxin [Rhodobacter sp. NSM]|uniref:type II toxin-antitoxin system CcdA family antitoxin n=1 Tax=Rhodobacter sp. NSM TaxID=3457501 RepID=UPI003FD38947
MNARPAARKPTNVSLSSSLIEEAKAYDVNLSRAAEEGVRAAVRTAKADAWRRENAEALKSSNSWVEQNGLPLEAFRTF